MSSTEGIRPIANIPTPIVTDPTRYPNADVTANSLMLFFFFVNSPMMKKQRKFPGKPPNMVAGEGTPCFTALARVVPIPAEKPPTKGPNKTAIADGIITAGLN